MNSFKGISQIKNNHIFIIYVLNIKWISFNYAGHISLVGLHMTLECNVGCIRLPWKGRVNKKIIWKNNKIIKDRKRNRRETWVQDQ